MKTAPTETDREAARLFAPSRRMRVWLHGPVEPAPVTVVSDPRFDGSVQCVRDGGDGGVHAGDPSRSWHWISWHWISWPPVAIDTDDDATKGVMLGQLRAAAGQPGLYVVAGDPDLDGAVWWSVPRRFAGRSAMSRTEGAALVAAKRALAEAAE